MPNIIQGIHEEITNELGTLKTDKDEDQVIINKLLKMIHCLRYDVYNNNIDLDFLKKVEFFKQYGQIVNNSETVIFFKTVIQKF